jgi:type I restriction enzyme S subunit
MTTLETLTNGRHERPRPAGWEMVRLRELIADVQSGFACGERDPHGVIQLRMNNVDTRGNVIWDEVLRVPAQAVTIMQYQLKPGDVLFNNTNSTELVGKSALFEGYDEAVVYSNHFTRLRTKSEVLLPAFLAAWLNHQWQLGVFARICNRWIGQSAVKADKLLELTIPLPPLAEQKRIVAVLREQMAAVAKARAAAEARLEAALALPAAIAADTTRNGVTQRCLLGDCLVEVRNGVGADWAQYPVLGATRAGLAPAKESVGKAPERYKLVDPVTVFYNPMRILLGSIAMVDDGDATGITSPDYVVVKGQPGVLDTRWFYYWFRSAKGAHLIESLSRGAVRERILFNRLAAGEIEIPDYDTQRRASEQMQQVRPVVDSIRKELETIDALPAAILRRVFAGAA